MYFDDDDDDNDNDDDDGDGDGDDDDDDGDAGHGITCVLEANAAMAAARCMTLPWYVTRPVVGLSWVMTESISMPAYTSRACRQGLGP